MDKSLIYNRYKQRLISLDSRNSSFFLSKLNPKKHIDLLKIINDLDNDNNLYEKLSKNEVITISRKEIDLDLFFISLIESKDAVKKIIPVFEQIDFDRFISLEEKIKNTDLYISYINSAENNDKRNIVEMYKKSSEMTYYVNEMIEKYEKKNHQILKQFENIRKQSKALERDFGKNDLFLGFPFLEGKFPNSKKDFRGPLVLHRIELVDNGNYIELKFSEENKIINPVFLLNYINENKKEYKQFDFEIPEDTKDYTTYAIEYLLKQNITIEQNESNQIITIESITKTDYANKYFNKANIFKVVNYAVFGLFPLSNRNIYNDIDYLDKNQQESSETLNNFFSNSAIYDYYEDIDTPPEESIKYITPIDWSQRIVIKNAIKDNLVIEGPPGTGKSQTIVNIIVNLLLKNKKILVVSEKLAAIEVVYNRLGSLRENALIIKDHIKNKQDFYHQIKDSSTRLNYNHGYRYDLQNDINISSYIEVLKEINNANFYNGLSFEKVEKIVKNVKEYKFSDIEKKLIKRYNDKIVKNDFDFEKYTKGLLDEVVIAKYDELNNVKNKSGTTINFNDLNFFIIQENFGNSKLQMQFNYYLNKSNKNIIDFYNLNELKLNVEKRVFSYHELGEYANNLFNKININKTHIIDYGQQLYDELRSNPNLINLVLKWDELDNKNKKIEIKKLYNEKFKLNFLRKIFKKNIIFDEREMLIYEYLQNYLNIFNMDMLKEINKNFNIPLDYLITNEFINRELSNVNELLSMLLNNNFIIINDLQFESKFISFSKIKNLIKLEDLEVISKFDDYELEIINLYKNSNLSKSDFIILLQYESFDDEIVTKTRRILKTIENDKDQYELVSNSFDKKYEASAEYVYNFIKESISKEFSSKPKLGADFKSLVTKTDNKRRGSINTIFKNYSDPLLTLYPVMLMTPEVVSSVFKMEENIFDYVIFDEASQMFIERAIPSIHRSNSVIIAGDSKQLKPTSTFMARISDSDEIDDDSLTIEQMDALDKESLLEIAKSKYKSKSIKFHYRSDYEELIEFSSVSFYNRDLFFSSKNMGDKTEKPIEVINVKDGIWTENNTNPVEAEEVVSIVSKVLKERKNNETIGIITFNIKQKDLIQELLNEEEGLIKQEFERTNEKTGDDESLFVKNIENVQGDERDIIIFSIGYAKNKDGRLKTQFGSLNQVGGENRLNVAITRAKKKIYLVKSIKSSELLVDNSKNEGPMKLKEYLEFAEYVSDGKKEEKNFLLNSIYDVQKNYNSELQDFDSPFEKDFYEELVKILPERIDIKNQVDVGNYKIDFALFDKVTNKFLLGLECDGYRWHSKPEHVERDFYRQQYLEGRGWKIHRILSTKWYNDKYGELNKINDILNGMNI